MAILIKTDTGHVAQTRRISNIGDFLIPNSITRPFYTRHIVNIVTSTPKPTSPYSCNRVQFKVVIPSVLSYVMKWRICFETYIYVGTGKLSIKKICSMDFELLLCNDKTAYDSLELAFGLTMCRKHYLSETDVYSVQELFSTRVRLWSRLYNGQSGLISESFN